MAIDWERCHPFDESCVEKDMVAKVFGWASDLHHDPALQAWKKLLGAVGIQLKDSDWEHVKVKFFAYPPHLGQGKGGGEVGDIVLLGPHLYVVIEAKRPGCGMDTQIQAKIQAARDLASTNKYGEKWAEPCFIMLGEARHENYPLLTWQEVSRVFRGLLGDDNAISRFVDRQISAQSPPVNNDRRPRKPGALSAVDRLLCKLGLDDSCEYVERPTRHWTYRRTRSKAAPMVAIALGDDAVQLRFKQVPTHLISHPRITKMKDFYASAFGKHVYAIDLEVGWENDPEILSLVKDCVLYAWG